MIKMKPMEIVRNNNPKEMKYLKLCGDDVGYEIECRLINGGRVIFDKVKMEDEIKNKLESVVEREGSRFGIECIRDKDGNIKSEMGLWILIYDKGIKLGDGKDVQNWKYCEVKYQSGRGNKSLWLEVDKKLMELEMVSINSRDMVVLSWRVLLGRQFMLRQKVMGDLERGGLGVDIWLEVDQIRKQWMDCRNINQQLKSQNEQCCRTIQQQEHQIQQMLVNKPVPFDQSKSDTHQEIQQLKKEIQKMKEKDMLMGYLDDRQKVQKEMKEAREAMEKQLIAIKRQLKEVERDRLEFKRQKEELEERTIQQEKYIRDNLKQEMQKGGVQVKIYEVEYERDLLKEKKREMEGRIKYLEGENERLKQMSWNNNELVVDNRVRELEQKLAHYQKKEGQQQEGVEFMKHKIRVLEDKLLEKNKKDQQSYEIENEHLENRNRQLQRKIDSLMQEMSKEKGNENFNLAIQNLQIANQKITEENIRLQEELKNAKAMAQSKKSKSIFG